MKKLIRSRKGFTLMEMVMVLVVIGLLVSIIVPRFGDELKGAKEATAKANLDSLRSAIGMYARNTGNYPTTLSDLMPDPLRSIPLDPWSYSYDYDSVTGEVYCNASSTYCSFDW